MNSDDIDDPAAVQSDSDEDIWQEEPQVTRKGDKSTCQKHEAKRRRDSGLAYISVKTKQHVPARHRE